MLRFVNLRKIPPVVLAVACIAGIIERADAESGSESTPAIYDSNPDHLWNRVHAALLVRTGPDGNSYGQDRLEPLLWKDTQHLRGGPSAERAVAVLDEFLRTNGEARFSNPVKRAVLQRDLWLIANWQDDASDNRLNLQTLLARVIRKLALTSDQIKALPDNYAAAVASKSFANQFDPQKPEMAYLPASLFQPDGPWVCVGRTDGRTAPMHLQSNANNSFTNSTFLVFVKLPGGRSATLAFLDQLARQKQPMFIRSQPNQSFPQLPEGTELALVRRALLIDTQSRVVASPLTESVQLRVIRTAVIPKTPDIVPFETGIRQMPVFDIQLRRAALFAQQSGGLQDVSAGRDFKTGFSSHAWDELEREPSTVVSFLDRSRPFLTNRHACLSCHRSASIYGTMSFQRYHQPSEKLDEKSPPLFPIAVKPLADVELAAVEWKEQQVAWKSLQKLLAE